MRGEHQYHLLGYDHYFLRKRQLQLVSFQHHLFCYLKAVKQFWNQYTGSVLCFNCNSAKIRSPVISNPNLKQGGFFLMNHSFQEFHFYCLISNINHLMCTIITCGLYIFYPIFHCSLYCRALSVTDNLCPKQENSSMFGSEIKSDFKTRAGYNDRCTVSWKKFLGTTKIVFFLYISDPFKLTVGILQNISISVEIRLMSGNTTSSVHLKSHNFRVWLKQLSPAWGWEEDEEELFPFSFLIFFFLLQRLSCHHHLEISHSLTAGKKAKKSLNGGYKYYK